MPSAMALKQKWCVIVKVQKKNCGLVCLLSDILIAESCAELAPPNLGILGASEQDNCSFP